MQKATVAYSIYIFDNSPCDERWMMKLQHLQTIQTCQSKDVENIWKQKHSAVGSTIKTSSRALPFKSWSLKSGEHMTFNSDIWISLIQNLANNAESDSCLQHLHIWPLSLNRDEWWNYRTSKPSKLVTVKVCRKHIKTEAFSGGLYHQNLITEILRTNICKYEKKHLTHLTQTCESLWCET